MTGPDVQVSLHGSKTTQDLSEASIRAKGTDETDGQANRRGAGAERRPRVLSVVSSGSAG